MNILQEKNGITMPRKGNLYTALCFIFLFIGILAVEKYVHYYGDDYYFLTFPQDGFWKMHLFHYLHNNGRSIVHFLITIFLLIDIRFWYIVNAFMLTATAYFIYRLSDRKPLFAFIPCAMILTMPVSLTNESVFWITGSLNYVYPSMLFMIYWYLIEKDDKTHRWGIWITAFFLSVSTEQGAVAVIVITLCHILYNMLILKRGMIHHLNIAFIISVIGALTIFLAPGNLERMKTEGVGSTYLTVIDGIEFLMRNVFVADYTVLFNVAAVFLSSIFLHEKGFKLISWLCIPFLVLMIIANKAGDLTFLTRFAYMLITITVCLFSVAVYFMTAVEYYKSTKSVKPAIAVTVGICTCVFLIPSPTIGARLLFITDILFIVYISCLASEVLTKRSLLVVFIAVISAAALLNLTMTIHGYYINDEVYRDNEAAINAYKQNPSETLTQRKLIMEDYGWSMPYNSVYHEYYYKISHGINEDTKILWE